VDLSPVHDSATSLHLSGVISCARLNEWDSGFGELLHRPNILSTAKIQTEVNGMAHARWPAHTNLVG
jgi:hypothetical protein